MIWIAIALGGVVIAAAAFWFFAPMAGVEMPGGETDVLPSGRDPPGENRR
jgi:hypothetical protein